MSSFAWAQSAAAADARVGRAEALFQEGLQLAAAGNTDAAIGTFAGLTRDYPRLWQPYAQLAALYVRKGELSRAIVPLQTALRLQSNVPALQEQLGDLYAQSTSQAHAEATPARTTAAEKARLKMRRTPPNLRRMSEVDNHAELLTMDRCARHDHGGSLCRRRGGRGH